MSVTKINKTMYHCKCESVNKDGTLCAYEWDADSIPDRCAGCKRRTWNRPARVTLREPLTFSGKTQTVAQWSRELGLSKTTIPWRLKQGWPLAQVLSNEDWRFGEGK